MRRARDERGNPAGIGDGFESRASVDVVARKIAVALLDKVPQVHADPELDAAIARHTSVALDEAARRQSTASITLRNSTGLPSPVRLTIRP